LETAIDIVQILVSTILVIVILLQVREMGTGLFGSATAAFRVRRGIEKTLFQMTIVLVAVFVVVSILSVRLN